jgi:hypothetical protein
VAVVSARFAMRHARAEAEAAMPAAKEPALPGVDAEAWMRARLEALVRRIEASR